MSIFQAIILSIVEGLTEFLPVSSTGHMILVGKLLAIPQTEFVKSFEIIIQLGAITAVVVLYFNTLIHRISLWPKLLAAFIPTAILGLIFYNIVKQLLLGNVLVTVYALGIGGLLFILLENIMGKKTFKTTTIDEISYKQSLIIGLVQSVSMIPGVSRSAASIFGAMAVGINRQTAVEFSFLLAIPTMAAATVLDLLKSGFSFSVGDYQLLAIGFAGAFITAIFAVKAFLKFIQSNTFIPFAWYRIALAVLFFFFFIK